MSGLFTVGYFLYTLLFSLLAFVLWIRIALRYFHVSNLHPVSQAINTLTNPIVTPFSRLFSSAKSRISRYDWASFCTLVVIEIIKFVAMGALFLIKMLPWEILSLYVVADLIVQPCNLLFYAIIVRLIMGWVNPNWHHPFADILRLVTEPLFQLGRRLIPNVSGFDFSPFIVMIILKVITLYIGASLPGHLV